MHSHTVHSDGTLPVRELACLAASQGLDFLAVTDHNTVSHQPELPAASAHAGVLLLPGQEVTTDLGHANVFGADGTVLVRPGGRRTAVRGDDVRIPAEGPGMHRLESHENEVIALCG
ncbi:PHP domain-containing protein [Spirillospora sp. NPDC127506]